MHREARKEMTQEKLGKIVGLSRTSITNIEQGRQHVPLHHLFSIANALKVPPAALLPLEDGALAEHAIDERLSENDRDIAQWAKRVIAK